MADFIFGSPGVKFQETQILNQITRSAGLTRGCIIGETPKGPAFTPVLVEDFGQFQTYFGGLSNERLPNNDVKYLAPFYANSFLQEANQLTVIRTLGLSGYDAGKLWALTLSAGVDPETTGLTSTVVTETGVTFENNFFMGVPITSIGQTGSILKPFVKDAYPSTNFTSELIEFTATTLSNGTGTCDVVTTDVTGTSFTEYENMVLGYVRARANVEDVVDSPPTTTFDANLITIVENDTITNSDFYAPFTIRAQNTLDSTSEDYTVSINPNDRNFISNVIGNKPKGKNTKIYVDQVYNDTIKKLDADGIAYAVNTVLLDVDTDIATNYKDQWQSPETPWIVSELRGNKVERLLKFESMSDGSSANQEIKISFTNINLSTRTFDVVVRNFNDTDDNIIVLESFSNCSMNPDAETYIAKRIGTADGTYEIFSQYITVEVDSNAPIDSIPAGFEGYYTYDYALTATTSTSNVDGKIPEIYYKTQYKTTDRVNRTYLGVSERGYDGLQLVGSGINKDLFKYSKQPDARSGVEGFTKTKGFHMDSGATGIYYDGSTYVGEFQTGAGQFRTQSDVVVSSSPYFNIATRKFTVVPAGGFDGWDEHRTLRTTSDLYAQGGVFDGVADNVTPRNDYQSYEAGLNILVEDEEVDVNIFATPGINWDINVGLVERGIEIAEFRTDTVYVIDPPNQNVLQVNNQGLIAAEQIVDSLNSKDYDTSYAATYYPYIRQEIPTTSTNVLIPPTGEVMRSFAFNDNQRAPWFAPAGLNRGTINSKGAKFKFNEASRDVLYRGRINPISTFSTANIVAIYGQKTLQIAEGPFDRINVRRLIIEVKRGVKQIANRFLFEQNDEISRNELVSQIQTLLDSIVTGRGIENYRVIADDTNNTSETISRNELYITIEIIPIGAIEFIGVDVTVTPAGVTFNEVGL